MAIDIDTGYIYERVRSIYVHHDFNLFLVTGVPGTGAKLQADITEDNKTVSLPNYKVRPTYEAELNRGSMKASILPVPFNALSLEEKQHCLSIAKPFNEKSLMEVNYDSAAKTLRIFDSCTGKTSRIHIKHLDGAIRHKLDKSLAPIV